MEEPGPRRDIRWGPLIGGVVLGWLASWVAAVVTGIALYSTGGDEGLSGSGGLTLLLAGIWLFPALLLLLLVWKRQGSQVVTGALLGSTVGAIAGAGVCTAMVSGS